MQVSAFGAGLARVLFRAHCDTYSSLAGDVHESHAETVMAPGQHLASCFSTDATPPTLDHLLGPKLRDQDPFVTVHEIFRNLAVHLGHQITDAHARSDDRSLHPPLSLSGGLSRPGDQIIQVLAQALDTRDISVSAAERCAVGRVARHECPHAWIQCYGVPGLSLTNLAIAGLDIRDPQMKLSKAIQCETAIVLDFHVSKRSDVIQDYTDQVRRIHLEKTLRATFLDLLSRSDFFEGCQRYHYRLFIFFAPVADLERVFWMQSPFGEVTSEGVREVINRPLSHMLGSGLVQES